MLTTSSLKVAFQPTSSHQCNPKTKIKMVYTTKWTTLIALLCNPKTNNKTKTNLNNSNKWTCIINLCFNNIWINNNSKISLASKIIWKHHLACKGSCQAIRVLRIRFIQRRRRIRCFSRCSSSSSLLRISKWITVGKTKMKNPHCRLR